MTRGVTEEFGCCDEEDEGIREVVEGFGANLASSVSGKEESERVQDTRKSEKSLPDGVGFSLISG